MSEGKAADHLSPKDLRGWMSEEVRNVIKECELRVREATEFTLAYTAGELTPEQAHSRLNAYERRWSQPLRGYLASSYPNDEELLKAIDEDVNNMRRRWRRDAPPGGCVQR